MFGGHQAVWRSVPGDKLVEIIYQDVKGQKIGRVRKAKAIDDISGDYKQYANIEKLAVGKDIVIVEGDNRSFCTAIWHENGYSYSNFAGWGISPSYRSVGSRYFVNFLTSLFSLLLPGDVSLFCKGCCYAY